MMQDFKFKFEGQLHQVSANTLINSLINFSTVIQEINKTVNPDEQVEINIKATEKGSFYLWLALNVLENRNTIIESTKDIITILVGLVALKERLEGKEPKKIKRDGDKIKIHTNNGTIIFTDQVIWHNYQNQKNQDAISNTFETLEEDISITGFEITDVKDKPLYRAERNNFEKLAVKSEIEEQNRKIIVEVADLYIFKIVFEDRYKWEFYYKGNKIAATIIDKTFFNRIDEGEKFAKGDTLTAEIEIRQLFDESVNTFVNNSYMIKKVLEHTPRGEQRKLNFNRQD